MRKNLGIVINKLLFNKFKCFEFISSLPSFSNFFFIFTKIQNVFRTSYVSSNYVQCTGGWSYHIYHRVMHNSTLMRKNIGIVMSKVLFDKFKCWEFISSLSYLVLVIFFSLCKKLNFPSRISLITVNKSANIRSVYFK